MQKKLNDRLSHSEVFFQMIFYLSLRREEIT
jgi:hypothetical protein